MAYQGKGIFGNPKGKIGNIYYRNLNGQSIVQSCPSFPGRVAPMPWSLKPVEWGYINPDYISDGASIKKITNPFANTGCGSSQAINRGIGYLTLGVAFDPDYIIGFNRTSKSPNDRGIYDFSMYLAASGGSQYIRIWEGGAQVYESGLFLRPNIPKIEIGFDGKIRYYNDGILLYTSTKVATYPLAVNAWIVGTGTWLGPVNIAAQFFD